MGQQWSAPGTGALAAADLGGMAVCGISVLGRGCNYPTIEPPSRQPTNWRTIISKKFSHSYESSRAHNRFTDLGIWQKGLRNPREFDFWGQGDLITEFPQDLGNRLLEGTNKTLCTPGPRRKEQWTCKRLSQICLRVSRSLGLRCGLTLACRSARGTECNSAGTSPFEGGHHYFHYTHHSLPLGETIAREHSPIHKQKIRLKIYWAWPHPSEQDPDSPTASLSHQETSTSLLSLSIRGQTEWKQQSQKTIPAGHMDHSLV